jgi:antitoxin MazE
MQREPSHIIGRIISIISRFFLTAETLVITMYARPVLGRFFMRAHIIRVGNSKGIRLPKLIIEQAGISEDVDIVVENKKIIIRPISSPRSGWDDAFREMAEDGDDLLLDIEQPVSNSWDETEWHW